MPGQFLANGGGLDVEGASPTDFVAVGNIISYDLGNFANARVDVSNLESPNNAKEYLQGQQDVPEASFELQVNPGSAQHQGLWTDSGSGTTATKQYRVRLGGSAVTPNFAGSAFVSGFQVTGSVDTAAIMALSIQWTQRPTANWS